MVEITLVPPMTQLSHIWTKSYYGTQVQNSCANTHSLTSNIISIFPTYPILPNFIISTSTPFVSSYA